LETELEAKAYIRSMNGGGSRAQLFEANDGKQYVTKLIGNGQGTRILANEFVVGKLGELIGAPCPVPRIIKVDQAMVAQINSKIGATFQPGLQFASPYIASPTVQVFPSTLDSIIRASNISSWASCIVLDTLTQNTDRKNEHVLISSDIQSHETRFWIVDHGHCLGVNNGWHTLNHQNAGLVAPIYREAVRGKDPFAEALDRLGTISRSDASKIISECPCDAWGVGQNEKQNLEDFLLNLAARIPKILNSSRSSFPRWEA
jgi:hypothetical protein